MAYSSKYPLHSFHNYQTCSLTNTFPPCTFPTIENLMLTEKSAEVKKRLEQENKFDSNNDASNKLLNFLEFQLKMQFYEFPDFFCP